MLTQSLHLHIIRNTATLFTQIFVKAGYEISILVPHKFDPNTVYLLFSCLLPIKQTINVEHRNISTPKTGIQDLVVKHYDCSPKHITYMQN